MEEVNATVTENKMYAYIPEPGQEKCINNEKYCSRSVDNIFPIPVTHEREEVWFTA